MKRKQVGMALLLSGFISMPVIANDQALQNQVFQLQSAQDNNKKQFEHITSEIKNVESQLSKLNNLIEDQLKQINSNTNKQNDLLSTSAFHNDIHCKLN